MKYIILGILWGSYVFISFTLFPTYNINIAIPGLVFLALTAWLLGVSKSLITVVFIILYHAFLFDYYGDILNTYQAKPISIGSPIIVVYLTGYLKEKRDQLKQLSVLLDQRVAERTIELNQLIEQLINDDERLRRSLGQDIHDGLGQNLTGLLLYSSLLRGDMESIHSPYVGAMNEIISDAERNLHAARKVSRTLFPFKMMEAGLEAALDELTSYFGETKSIAFEVDLDKSQHNLHDDVVLHLYRIIYESILNTIHNDNPTRIQISLSSDDKILTLNIIICGCYDPDSISNNMFIELMRYRAKLIHGLLSATINSRDEIKITCHVPRDLNSNDIEVDLYG